MKPDFSGAPCIGRPELFQSTHAADHHEARELCATCPALDACKVLLREVQEGVPAGYARNSGPCGTWAGKLVGGKGAGRSSTRYKPLPREHGTDRGYHQHRWNGEAACEPCKAAHTAVWHARKAG